MKRLNTHEPASHTRNPRLGLHFVVALSGLLAGLAQCTAAQTADGAFLPNSSPYGKSYAEWSAAWWRWTHQ